MFIMVRFGIVCNNSESAIDLILVTDHEKACLCVAIRSAVPLRLCKHLITYSLLGGNRYDVTTNCTNPQLRNAQLPGNVVHLYARANVYISCVYAFACAFA